MKTGDLLITEKRKSHLKKGFDYKHDTGHSPQQFINAASAYVSGDINRWPFDKESFKTGKLIDDLVNAGSMVAAAIDRLNRYEVGKVYECKGINQDGTFKVTGIKCLNSGTVLIQFIGLTGHFRPDKQQFMLTSPMDLNSNPYVG